MSRSNGVVDRRRRSTGFNQDVVIVLDGSGSAGRCEFEKVKEALNRTLETLYASNSKIAAITFSSSATVNFKFLDPSTAIERITQISFPGGGTNTAGALDKVMELFDDTSSGKYLEQRVTCVSEENVFSQGPERHFAEKRLQR